MMQEHSALVSKNYDQLPREANKTKDSTADRIYKYFHNSKTRIQLTEEEMQIMHRWEKAWLLLCRHRTRKDVVDLIMRLYGIEKSVAYDDVRNAMNLFSDPGDDLKEAKRRIAEDAYLKGAAEAWKKRNLDMHLKYMKEYSEINKLTKDADQASELIEFMRKLKPTKITIVTSMEDSMAAAEKLRQEITEDISHTEISDEGEGN